MATATTPTPILDRLLYDYTYYLYGYWIEIQDPRTAKFWLVSVQPYTIALLMYCYYALVTKIGPTLLKNHPPFEIRWIMFIYNALMVIINAYFFYESIYYCDYFRVFLNFDYPDYSDNSPHTLRAINLGWWYWMSKFADWLDTLFYVLRKKHDHINFLHLYHHISVPVFGYLLMKINPLVPAAHIFIIINTFVHCCMYSYYALAALGPWIRKYLWWKRYITMMQLSQFVIGALYGCLVLKFQRGYPPVWLCIGISQPPFFYYMFYQFYKKAYKSKPDKQDDVKIATNNHKETKDLSNGVKHLTNGSFKTEYINGKNIQKID